MKRYREYWVSHMEKQKVYFFTDEQIEEYVRMFPKKTQVIMEKVVFNCCEEGHTFRQIMGYDELDH